VVSRKRLRSNDLALIGIVLLACGIAILAAGAGLGERLAATAGLWTSALVVFGAARQPGRRR
jgi:hypothetical protein